MERKKTSDFSPAVLKDFDLYVHGLISRREFLNRSARFAVGGVTAAAILDSLQPNFAWARSGCGCAILWCPATGIGSGGDQGTFANPLCRAG